MKPGNGLDKQPVGGNQPAQTSTATPGLQNAPEGKPEAAGQFAQRGKKSVSVDNSRILVMLVGFALVLLLCAYAMVRSHEAASAPGSTTKKTGAQSKPADSNAGNEHHFLPTTNAAQSGEPDGDDGYATSKTVEQTATNHPNAVTTAAPPPPNTGGGTLASVPPFTAGQSWEPPPYQPGAQGAMPDGVALDAKAEREAMDKASLVFVRSASSSAAKSDAAPLMVEPELGLGLPPAAKLRARLESAANTAVETPVTAVIEYNYERNGEIVVPAGAKAIGRLQQADRSGYVGIRFDSLVLPDGSTTEIAGTATDLGMRALKGKVEGKNTGKNILVRSVSGIGEVAAMLVGRNGVNQPLSEGDMLRERVGSNIGQASDEQLQRMAMGEHIVVSLPAGTEIYVVLQQAAKPKLAAVAAGAGQNQHPEATANAPTAQELRQLLQLQRELNEQSAARSPSE